MIPKVRHGHDLPRLMAYLVGPGEANEHTNPHLVAGSSWHMAWHLEQELTVKDARAIGRDLESPTLAHNVMVKNGHVWHCPLSIEAGEGQLSDARWGEIAEKFMTRMGFITDDVDEPSLRWVAVRHGLSKNGNDHIHLAVNLVHEDGSVANLWPRSADGKPVGDYTRAQAICRDLEVEYGLRRVGMAGRSIPGYEPGEIEAEGRRRAQAKHEKQCHGGQRTPRWEELTPQRRAELAAAERPSEAVRFTLARRVRGCAVAAADEAEFVRRLRGQGVLVRPWFARGTQGVIEGYRVAMRPVFGERPIWFGGGKLGKDLSLPRLREEWPDTPQTAAAAAAEWQAAWRGVRVANPGRETTGQPAGLRVREQIGQDVELLAQRLRFARHETPALWARTAHQVSGALASWSAATEPTPGPLAAAADAIAASASYQRPAVRPDPGGTLTLDNTAMLFALIGKTGKARDRIIQAMLLRQMVALGASIARMHTAIGDVQRAEHINRVLTEQLTPQADRLDPPRTQANDRGREPAGEPMTQLPAAVLATRPPSRPVIPPKLPTGRPASAGRPWVPPIVRTAESEQAR